MLVMLLAAAAVFWVVLATVVVGMCVAAARADRDQLRSAQTSRSGLRIVA